MPDKHQSANHQLDGRQLCTSIEARAGAAVIGTLKDQEGREVAHRHQFGRARAGGAPLRPIASCAQPDTLADRAIVLEPLWRGDALASSPALKARGAIVISRTEVTQARGVVRTMAHVFSFLVRRDGRTRAEHRRAVRHI
jgi:hypothetical protein